MAVRAGRECKRLGKWCAAIRSKCGHQSPLGKGQVQTSVGDLLRHGQGGAHGARKAGMQKGTSEIMGRIISVKFLV